MEAQTERKYCEGCRFFQASPVGARFGRCGHSSAAQPPDHGRFVSRDLDKPAENNFASMHREYGACGSDAKLFEERAAEEVAA